MLSSQWLIFLSWPVTLILTSKQRSWVTGTVDLLVTTPLLTVFGITAPVVLVLMVVPQSVLLLLGQLWRGSALPDAFSIGILRKSLTSWSQSKMRKTLKLLRTTVKQDESRVDLQEGGTQLFTIKNLCFYWCLQMFHRLEHHQWVPIMKFELQWCPISACFRGLQDAVKDIRPSTNSSISGLIRPSVPSVMCQQRVRHQVDRLRSIGETLKEQLGFHEVKSL